MKTLRITRLDTGSNWLETDSAFKTLFQNQPDVLRSVAALEPTKHFYFSAPGEFITSLRISLMVTRLAWPDSPSPGDVAASVLALAVFVSGLFMVPR